jgi:hypothetical protein
MTKFVGGKRRMEMEATSRSGGGFRVLVSCVLIVAAVTSAPPSAGASPGSDLQAAKAATARYHAVKQATRDGYVQESPCIASPDGAMGIHYVNPGLAGDAAVHPRHPEMLLYLPTADGKLRLIGVEYFVAAADQEPPIDNADTPHLFGRAFDGPMEGHGPGQPYHYDLHVWLWADNPAGLFAPFNLSLACPS